MPASAPAVADDRYSTSKTGTQTSLNSTILVAQIELIEENGCVTIREMATKTRMWPRSWWKVWDARKFVPVGYLAE
jgi:hypothetical protein